MTIVSHSPTMQAMSQPLVKSKERVWRFIVAYYADNGYMPTLQEIANAMSTVDASEKSRGITRKSYSRQWARYVVNALVDDGRIKFDKYKHRGITLA